MHAPVIQAYFPGGRPPARLVTRMYPSPHLPPHEATLQKKGVVSSRSPHAATLQKKDAPGKAPHPATLQKKDTPGGRSPHPATLQKKDAPGKAPHPATTGKTRRAAATPQPAQSPLRTAVQRSAAGDDVHAFQTPAGFLDASAKRKAQELPPILRRKMESFFETDLSAVRVHVGPEAPAIGALAFTLGTDIYFAPGQYQPDTPQGHELLGHELTHVLQQREGRVANPFGDGTAVVQDRSLEDEADRMGRLLAARDSPSTSYRRELANDAVQRAQARPRERGSKSAQRRGGSHQLVVGAYMHESSDKLPEPLAGHSFVAIEDPGGHQEAFGFSPAGYGEYDPKRDLGKLASGVQGVVHDDANAFGKPGVKTRAYAITEAQASAARAKIAEYQAGKHRFSLKGDQCSAFAVDVAKAAEVEEVGGLRGKAPGEVYKKL